MRYPSAHFVAPVVRSARAKEVAKLFGLPATPSEKTKSPPVETFARLPAAGEITLLTGASGGGKSSLLRSLVRLAKRSHVVIDLAAIHLPPEPLVDLFPSIDTVAAMRLLAAVGLGEAWTYLRTPREISTGQRSRLRLAMALHRALSSTDVKKPPLIVCDEFAADLDRLTARLVASRLRHFVTTHRLRAIVVTSADDLTRVLRADSVVRCDFSEVRVESTTWKGACGTPATRGAKRE